MGTSTNGILAYGHNFGSGDEWHIAEVDEYGSVDVRQVPWLVADSEGYVEDFVGQCSQRLLGEEPDGDADFWVDPDRMRDQVGVFFEDYCSGESPMWLLATHAITVYRGDVKTIDVAALAQLAGDEGWDEKLAAAVAKLGVTPKQDKPAWLLCSYWG